MNLFRTKPIEQSLADADEPEYKLKKRLSALDLTVFGIGVIIGAGIFTVTGRAASTLAGPAIVISFILAAVGCGLAALCYAEFSSSVPVSGSAYTFSYAALGEILAWIIGWDMLLEMLLATSCVAQGWSAYLMKFLKLNNIHYPEALGAGGAFDLLSFLLIIGLGLLIYWGIKESTTVNLVLVCIKLFIVLFVIILGLFLITPGNYVPFIPDPRPTPLTTGLTQPLLQALTGAAPSAYGVSGIFAGAALVFFAYIGFDVVATTAEETKNPKKDLPIGIIASLAICTVLYIAVALVVTGMVKYDQLNPQAALAEAFATHGIGWAAKLIAAGAVAGLTTVVLTLMIGATRLIFAMSRDRLLPGFLSRVQEKNRTPWVATLIVTILCAFTAAFTKVGVLEEMINIGTLSAFVLVSIAVIVLRYRRPDLPRAFKVPLMPVIPILSVLVCTLLMLNLSVETWLRFVIWLAIGLVIYFAYGYWHSRVGKGDGQFYSHPGEAEPKTMMNSQAPHEHTTGKE